MYTLMRDEEASKVIQTTKLPCMRERGIEVRGRESDQDKGGGGNEEE